MLQLPKHITLDVNDFQIELNGNNPANKTYNNTNYHIKWEQSGYRLNVNDLQIELNGNNPAID